MAYKILFKEPYKSKSEEWDGKTYNSLTKVYIEINKAIEKYKHDRNSTVRLHRFKIIEVKEKRKNKRNISSYDPIGMKNKIESSRFF